MKVHLPCVSTPNRPSAAESSRRCKDSWRSRTWSSVSAWTLAARRTKATPLAASNAASAALTTRSSRCVCRDASPSCAENLLSSCVRRLLRWSAWARISDADAGLDIAAQDPLARALGELAHLLDDDVAVGPRHDRVGHERDAVEPSEQADQAVDVVGVIAALQEAAARDREVGVGPLQLLARDAIAERDRERLLEAPVVVLLVVLRVVEQIDLRVLLALGIEALAGHVGAHRRQQSMLTVATTSCRR